jgi:hypothetical protein
MTNAGSAICSLPLAANYPEAPVFVFADFKIGTNFAVQIALNRRISVAEASLALLPRQTPPVSRGRTPAKRRK